MQVRGGGGLLNWGFKWRGVLEKELTRGEGLNRPFTVNNIQIFCSVKRDCLNLQGNF